MTTSSSQKFIARNRVPRVQIEYDVELYGADKKIEIPFIVGVFADLAGRSNDMPLHVSDRRMLEIDIDNFDDRLRKTKPRVTFTVPNTIGESALLEVDVTFESLEDFSPAAVARAVVGLDTLLEQRTQLANLLTYMDGKAGTELVVERLLNDRKLLGKITSQEQIYLTDKQESAVVHPSDMKMEPKKDSADAILKSIAREFNPKTDGARHQVKRALQTLANQALPDSDASTADPFTAIEAFIERIDHQLTAQLNLIFHHPEFQQLEGAWRGLHFLVINTETDEMLKIRFMSLSKQELSKTIRKYKGSAWDQSPLFKKIYEDEYGQFGGEPYGCLIGDYEFGNSSDDIMILREVARIAAAAHTPFITAASPSAMQMASWQEIATPRNLSKLFSAPDYDAWRSLRDSEDSKYLALTMPRFLARYPCGEHTDPVHEFAFQEDCNIGDSRYYTWCNSAYAMGVNITRAFSLYGWCVRIRGMESGGIVDGLPTHVFPTDDGSIDMHSPTEVSISDRWEAELTRSGFMPLVHWKNSDTAVFLSAQSFHKAAEFDDPDATANAALAARLPFVLASCRFAHYLRCLVRDRIGSFVDRADMEYRLNAWIKQYVDTDPAGSSEETKARKPLADAEIVLDEIEGNPSYYACKFYIRPHYQLFEGLTISLRLDLKLPSEHPA